MATTVTRSTTHTSTLTKIVYVSRKVQADLLAIQDLYEYFPENYAKEIVSDLRHFLDEEVIDRVKFVWIKAGTTIVLEELEYVVVVGGLGLADDRAGGIRYATDLSKARFQVIAIFNSRWLSMDENQKGVVREGLRLNWGPAGQLEYSGGKWADDRSYSSDGYALVRRHYTCN